MTTAMTQRLRAERERLDLALARWQELVRFESAHGDPPTAYRLVLQPFALWVQEEGDDQPHRYAPARHGRLGLALAADPDRYPFTPWAARVSSARGVKVFNPHVGADGAGRGLICWHHEGALLRPGWWTVDRVLAQVLRILAAEVYALEGFALNEDAKVWFARHAGDLPFARVPDVEPAPSSPDPLGSPDPLASTSAESTSTAPRSSDDLRMSRLGIEFDDGGGP